MMTQFSLEVNFSFSPTKAPDLVSLNYNVTLQIGLSRLVEMSRKADF